MNYKIYTNCLETHPVLPGHHQKNHYAFLLLLFALGSIDPEDLKLS